MLVTEEQLLAILTVAVKVRRTLSLSFSLKCNILLHSFRLTVFFMVFPRGPSSWLNVLDLGNCMLCRVDLIQCSEVEGLAGRCFWMPLSRGIVAHTLQ